MAPGGFDLAETFVHLADRGGAEAFAVTPAFWRGEHGACGRVLGAVDFRSPRDLHPSVQEVHPAADEVLLVIAGALDAMLEENGGERAIALAAGQAAVVPRG